MVSVSGLVWAAPVLKTRSLHFLSLDSGCPNDLAEPGPSGQKRCYEDTITMSSALQDPDHWEMSY